MSNFPTIRPHWINSKASQLEVAPEHQVFILDTLNKRDLTPSRWHSIGTISQIDPTTGKNINEMDTEIWFDFDDVTADALFFKLEGEIPNLKRCASRNMDDSKTFNTLHALLSEGLKTATQTSVALSTLSNAYGIDNAVLWPLTEKLRCAPSPIFTRRGFFRALDGTAGPQYLFAARSEAELAVLKLR